MQMNFEFLKFIIRRSNFKIFATFNEVTVLLDAFKLVFLAKACFKVVAGSVKLGKP